LVLPVVHALNNPLIAYHIVSFRRSGVRDWATWVLIPVGKQVRTLTPANKRISHSKSSTFKCIIAWNLLYVSYMAESEN